MIRRFVRAAACALALIPTLAAAQIPASEYAARRDSLAARVSDGVILALGAREPVEDYLPFYQASPFMYLTGLRAPNAALVMVKQGGRTTSTLFVEPKDPAREVWTGNRPGPAGATKLTGIPARSIEELRPVLDSLLGTAKIAQLHVVGDYSPRRADLTVDDQFVRALQSAHAGVTAASANTILEQLRGKKSAAELDLIRKAVAITVDAQRAATQHVAPGLNEFEVQALIEYTFRRNGADRPSFATIVGSGPNSTTLHYNADDRFMKDGEVVVMDIGASYRGYAADVTRTVPVNGKFSPAQRDIYQLVRDAQAAAERQAKLGAQSRLMADSATATLGVGLTKLGLIESPTATYDCDRGTTRGQCSQVSLFYMHGLGHGIGLDVHDPEQYYLTGVIAPGSAFTIEPGVYVRENLLEILPKTPRNDALIAKIRPAVQRYASIGVRIEDDYIATERGVEWISRAPREITEIEALMQQRLAGPTARDTAKVEWYRKTAEPQ